MTVDRLVLRFSSLIRFSCDFCSLVLHTDGKRPRLVSSKFQNSLIYNDFTVISEHPRNLSYKLKTKIQLEMFYFFNHFLLLEIIRTLFLLHSHSADR